MLRIDPPPFALTRDLAVTLRIDDDAPVTTTLSRFLADNAEGLGEATLRAAAETLLKGGGYSGGGGAGPRWSLRPAVNGHAARVAA